MKLWLLCPVEDLQDGGNPWKPPYGKAYGFVVRAETEGEARVAADAEAGAENWYGDHPWKDARHSSCVELRAEGEPGVVMQDLRDAG